MVEYSIMTIYSYVPFMSFSLIFVQPLIVITESVTELRCFLKELAFAVVFYE